MNAENCETFHVNDYIFHGGSGVCVVEDICIPKHMQRLGKTRKYYRLHPLYEANSVIYTPIDNTTSIVRRILSKSEAIELIRRIPSLETLWIDDEKQREETYRTALRTNNCYEWMRVIKTLYERGEARKKDGKRPWQSDEKYLQLAEDLLYGELAVPLGIPKSEVRSHIVGQVKQGADKFA